MQAIAPALTFDAEPGRVESGVMPARPEIGRIEAFESLAEAASAWRRLEGVAPCTPYGQFAWAQAWCATVGADRRQTPLVAAVYDRRDQPTALFPFVVRSAGGLRIARFVGGKDSNGNLALFAEPEAWDGATLRAVLGEIGARAGVDAFALQNQPLSWRGRPNPFALLPHQASPSGVAATDLPAGTLAKQARKRLRQKTGWLEAIGPVVLQRATSRDEVDVILAAYVAQRTARAEAAGVGAPTAPQVDFYRQAADPLRPGGPCVELFALRCGSDIVATFGGTGLRGRYSGMILSIDAHQAVARCSPGELLLRRLLPELAARGVTRFDLGIGEARYKDSVCDEREPLFDCFVAVTTKGRVAALALAAAARLKRTLKQSGPAFTRVRRLAVSARRLVRVSRP